jgi:hypothetical protein
MINLSISTSSRKSEATGCELDFTVKLVLLFTSGAGNGGLAECENRLGSCGCVDPSPQGVVLDVQEIDTIGYRT